MSPLLIVGILFLASPSISTPEADVKTKCQNDPACYWWTGQDSPFKQKGAHVKNPSTFNNGVSQNNPFFNGEFEKLPTNAGFNKEGEKVDISNNPFFNKEKPIFPTAHPAQTVPTEHKKPDYSQNPFLQNMFTANGSKVRNEGFIGVQPKPFSTLHPLEKVHSTKLDDDDEYTLGSSDQRKLCPGDEFVCLPVSQCPNGVLPDYLANGLQSVKNAMKSFESSLHPPCDSKNHPPILLSIHLGKTPII
ncbi:hypothetical protein WA026_002805 [Henosepilachna vigintioctopunctata]|uniref:Uncharacterized protein n=1 Tax=Henosepilachna vigintioctopunctata TaxID=420089 RepID=A0AAW1TVZ9_9CUCU